MAEKLEIQKRISHITIGYMEAPLGEVDGKTLRVCLNGCGKPIPKENRKYCSAECASQFWAKHSQKGLREYLFKRDHGTCQMCGWKNPKFGKPYPRRPSWVPGGVKAHNAAVAEHEKVCEAWGKEFAEWSKAAPKARDFTADHKVPIALGGAEFDLNNTWLICDICDKKKTAKDQAKIAKRRKLIKRVGKNGKPLSAFLKEVSA